MRRVLLFLIIAIACLCCGTTADLLKMVPLKDVAYSRLRFLCQHNFPMSGRELFNTATPREVSRFDFSLALIEPLQCLTALGQDTPSGDPAQQQLRELALHAYNQLTPIERGQYQQIMGQLIHEFSDVIEAIQPELPQQAAAALRKLAKFQSNPMPASVADTGPSFSFSVNPSADANPIGVPLPSILAIGDPSALPMRAPGAADRVGTFPVKTLQVEGNLLYRQLRLYTSLATLPSQDPAHALLPIDLQGRAKVRLEMNLANIRNLPISGMFEFHIQRYTDQNTANVSKGMATGVKIEW